MDKLTEDGVREIEQIHSSWIEFEVAGEGHRLMTLCADDIELLPPDAQPVLGRAAVSARLAHGNTRVHDIEITNRLIRGSNEIAYLTANYKTTFSSPEDSTPRQTFGSHLWILQKQAGTWVITLVSWSLWGAISGPTAHPLREASANSRLLRLESHSEYVGDAVSSGPRCGARRGTQSALRDVWDPAPAQEGFQH